jgi:hypothetical protein
MTKTPAVATRRGFFILQRGGMVPKFKEPIAGFAQALSVPDPG